MWEPLENVLGAGCYCEKTNASVEHVLMQFSSPTENLVQRTLFSFISISVLCVCAPPPTPPKKNICSHEIKGKSKREFSFNDFLFSFFLSFSFLVQKALTLPIHFPPRYKCQQPSLVVRQLSIISLCILFKIV